MHAIDFRANDSTFKDQHKFWLEPAQIFKANENRSPYQSSVEQECVFMHGGCKAYSSSKPLSDGQYVIPFSFKLPENIPGTFAMGIRGPDGKVVHEVRVRYTVEMFLDTDKLGNPELRDCFTCEHEFEVREFLFTDEEVAQDVRQQQLEDQVKTLFKTKIVLKPVHIGASNDSEKAIIQKL